jgi:hypothetical protein
MQAMEITLVKRIGIAAVALGTLTIGLVGANAVQDATQAGSDARPVAVTRSIAPVDQAAQTRYIEWNTQLPSAVAPVRSAAEIAFLEQNVMLPTGSVAVAPSIEQIRFLEMNQLPESSVVAPARRADFRFIEINQLPGDELVAPEVIPGTPS